ncbi:MutS protein msh5, partial [Mortierella claussenii]
MPMALPKTSAQTSQSHTITSATSPMIETADGATSKSNTALAMDNETSPSTPNPVRGQGRHGYGSIRSGPSTRVTLPGTSVASSKASVLGQAEGGGGAGSSRATVSVGTSYSAAATTKTTVTTTATTTATKAAVAGSSPQPQYELHGDNDHRSQTSSQSYAHSSYSALQLRLGECHGRPMQLHSPITSPAPSASSSSVSSVPSRSPSAIRFMGQSAAEGLSETDSRENHRFQERDGGEPLFPTAIDFEEKSYHHDHSRSRRMQSEMMQSPEESALGQEIIVAVNVKGRKMGCAYYDGQLLKLFVMHDMIECKAIDMIKIVKAQVRPTLILANTRLDEDIMDVLRFDETGQETITEVLPGGDFSYSTAKSKLISIWIGTMRSEIHTANMSRISGGNFMEARPHASDMDDTIQRDAQLHLSNAIDLQSMESIFEDETHPSMHSSIRGRKEGFSLFGILNQTKTSQGRYLLKQWLLRPSLDKEVIHARHQAVECFVRTENQETVRQLASYLSHVKNIPKTLQALPRKATLTEWQSILQVSLKIYNGVQEVLTGDSPIIQEILRNFVTKDLMDVGSFINDMLDFDESVIEGRCVIKHNVDEELDRMRNTYHGLDSFLSECAKEISSTIPSDFTSTINVIYFPQLGYLITMPMNPNWKTDQDFYLEGLCYQFSTESTVYYKNSAMRELDEHLGDIHGLIVGMLDRIERSTFFKACRSASLTQVARLRNYKRPTMTEENILHIIKGRHPLQELVVDSFVANDTQLGEMHCVSSTQAVASSVRGTTTDVMNDEVDSDVQLQSEQAGFDNRIMIISGANSSGKSVYLKQVALITYMAHIGSFVPADSAVIGITDKILTRLQTRETVSS